MTLLWHKSTYQNGPYWPAYPPKTLKAGTHPKPSMQYAPWQPETAPNPAGSDSAINPTNTLSQSSQFSVFRALKETAKGILRPIGTLIQHPFKTALTLAGTIMLTTAAPITVPIMVAVGLATGGWQLLSGAKSAITEAKRGNYTSSEKAFGHIGEGSFGVVSSLLGIRQAGTLAAEAKAARLSISPSASTAQKLRAIDQGLEAAVKVQNGSWQNAFRETLSVFSPKGIETTAAQLNPVRLGALAKGKTQSLMALFQEKQPENPLLSLKEAVAKAQRFLKIKDKDMPTIEPHLRVDDSLDLSQGTLGFYHPKNHSLHVEPNRQKAFRDQLGPVLGKWFDQLPSPLQKLLRNRHTPVQSLADIVTHELTHSRQFNHVAQLSRLQASNLLHKKFPGITPQQIDTVLDQLRLQGSGLQPVSTEGQRVLTQVAEFQFNQKTLREIRTSQQDFKLADQMKANSLSFNQYVRAGFEVEARQKAAEAGIAETVKTLAQATGSFAESQLLQQYKRLKIEGKLNKLLNQLNRTKPAQTPQANLALEQQLASWTRLPAQIHQHGSLTQRYLLTEQTLQKQTRQLNQLSQFAQKLKETKTSTERWSLQTVGTRLTGWLKGMVSGIKRFFSPAGLKHFEQQHQTLKGSYLQLNQQMVQASQPT